MELHAYFQSYEDYFWQWETDSDVPDASGVAAQNLLSVPGYGAIAYRPLVEEILKALQPQGLPPFGALLLVLMATQESFTLAEAALSIIEQSPQLAKNGAHHSFPVVKILLRKINALERQYKKGQNRLLLLQVLFKDIHNLHSAGSADMLLRKLEKRPYKLSACAAKEPLADIVIYNELRCLNFVANRFPTTLSIKEAMKGFLAEPDLEEEIIEEAIGIAEEKDFVQQLEEEPKTFHIGSLIKRIWSGLKIPMRHLSPGEQPIGGISDMTNKGDLPRMLLSEFANEDEVFLSRIANSEALYIQREIPPEENIFERVILIDGSLKNWGTPKILAFAVALAIVKHPKANTSCRVFVLGATFREIMVSTIDEVISSLTELSPVLDTAHAAAAFFEAHKDQELEAFLVTHEDCLKSEAMLKTVQEHREQLKYIVATTLEGEVNIFKHHNGTKKHVQKIVLPLEELWAKLPQQNKNAAAKDADTIADLPKNYPLLFPTPKDAVAIFHCDGFYYLLSAAKDLYKIHTSEHTNTSYPNSTYHMVRGAELAIEDISVKSRGKFALTKNSLGELVLFQFQSDKNLISRLNLETKEYADMSTESLFVDDIFYVDSFHVAPGDNCIYCYENSLQDVFQFPAEGELVNVTPTALAFDISKKITDYKAALERHRYNFLKIVKGFHNIGINVNREFVFSKNRIELFTSNEKMSIRPYKALPKYRADQYKNTFRFSDGSVVTTDKRGIMIFKSADKNIPEFYIPAVNQHEMAIATADDFGGGDYFIDPHTTLTRRPLSVMYNTYLKPFIQHIIEHGTED